MTSSGAGSLILFIVFFLITDDVLASIAFSVGPIAIFLLVSTKEEIMEDDLRLRAGEWIQRAIMSTVLGLVYTGGIWLLIGLIGLFLPDYELLDINFYLIIIAFHFIMPAYKHFK